MLHTEDCDKYAPNHVLTINVIDSEEYACEEIIMALYREGTIGADTVSIRLSEVKKRIKHIREQVCELHNIVDRGTVDCL